MSAVTGLPALDNTLGALYIGIVVSMGLWGVGTVQFYYYFQKYPKDSWRLKSLVGFVWTLDTIHQGLITHAGYKYLVTEYANVAYLNVIVPTMEVMVLFSAIVALSVQCFLIYRVLVLSQKNYYLVIPLLVLSFSNFGCTVAFFGLGVQLSSFAEVPTIAWLSKTTNGLTAATDVVIAAVLITLLNRVRTGFRQSETMINRLIIFTVNTGALTSICALFAVTFVSVWPDNYIYIVVFFAVCRLYCNSLLATLNDRRATRAGMYSDGAETADSISITPRSRAVDHSSRDPGRAFAIKVETSVSRADDSGNLRETPSWSDVNDVELSDRKASLSAV